MSAFQTLEPNQSLCWNFETMVTPSVQIVTVVCKKNGDSLRLSPSTTTTDRQKAQPSEFN